MKVVFSQAMVAPVQGYSPSAAKPAVVMAAWREAWPNLETKPAQPATLAELYRAHDRAYVETSSPCAHPTALARARPRSTPA